MSTALVSLDQSTPQSMPHEASETLYSNPLQANVLEVAPHFGLIKPQREDMDNELMAEVRRYISRASIQVLSEQATEEDDHVRVQQFCHILMAMFIQRFQGSTRLDHILRSISTDRAQHPKLRKIAEELDKVFEEHRDDLIIYLVGDLKHPERSNLNIPITPELAEKIAKRAKGQRPS